MEITITYGQLKSELSRILSKYGFSDERADKCAEIFAINTLEGVYTHGINRFPRFVGNVRDGYVKADAVHALVHSFGAIE